MRTSTRRARAGIARTKPLLQAVYERDFELKGHTNSVAALSVEIGRRLGLTDTELEELDLAAQLHDVGKIAVPDEVLHKPGPLSESDWSLIRQHTIVGQRILSAPPALRRVGEIVRATHERWDGGGYPDGLAGEGIPARGTRDCGVRRVRRHHLHGCLSTAAHGS